MDSENTEMDQFEWVDYGPPYGDVNTTPDWDDTAEQVTITEPPAFPDRYASLGLQESGAVIYDRGDTNAWIQSTTTRFPEDYRDIETPGTGSDQPDPNGD